jgi:hypothetical protein
MSPHPFSNTPGDILQVLRALRGRIRRYVVLEGAALVLVTISAAFWLSLSFDYWFEWPAMVRRLLLVLAMVATVGAAGWWLLLRLARDFRSPALALVLERRFPELNDRLITAVELCEQPAADSMLSTAMLRQVAGEAVAAAHRLKLREVFNVRPLLKAASAALLLIVSIVAFRLVAPDTFDVWFRRNLLMADELYRRETELRIFVLAEPDERMIEFRHGVYKHPRGADFTFVAEVLDGKKVPETVHFSYRLLERSGGSSDSMIRTGERRFRQKLAALNDSLRLSIYGGDFSTREPLVVQIVDPPQIDQLSLSCRYPKYTGLNLIDENSGEPLREDVPVLGPQVEIPAGTDFILHGRANKKLKAVHVVTDLFSLYISKEAAEIQRDSSTNGLEEHTLRLNTTQPLLDADGRNFRVPFALSVAPDPQLTVKNDLVMPPLAAAPTTQLQISFLDEDEVFSTEPARLTVVSKADTPPKIEARLRGVSTTITRQATIPIVGDIRDPQDPSNVYGVTDDYGIADAQFEFKLEGSAEPRKFPLSAGPGGARQFVLEEKFKVLPLDLSIGQKFTLKVTATDGDDLTGPHKTAGPTYAFHIVSDDELLALIATRELNIRRRFEQIIEEVKLIRKELGIAQSQYDESRSPGAARSGSAGSAEAGSLPVSTTAVNAVDHTINAIRKNATETASIEQEFRDIRDELENNAVPDVKVLLARIDDGIVKPLHSINTLDYNTADDALVLLRKAFDDRTDPAANFDESVAQINLTIEHLEAVLAQMLKLETVNEALQMLRDIIKSQEDLQEKTKNERKRKLIEGLK